ncbi:transcriptional regulator [Streptomyces sp. 150FB]|uniref:WhiB family transcriptional regulator n=1 Tax=Streptomyces sp. 150FB TaxID=1576605 RepID=UPI00058905F2|nr:WhiB family transcriptional regulator [Streptomyces sp. 150FB]KIF72738.1 transcriptional regulator [Streptomyces sp. 150FB]
MPGKRAGVPNTPGIVLADTRIPFPYTEQRLRCRETPALFEIEDIHNTVEDPRAREKALATTRTACSGCPIVTACLKWALANADLTATGVWAATTAPQRDELRTTLAARLGHDWVGVVAEQDHRRAQRQPAPRVVPPTREQAFARLEPELIPTRPDPYNPWSQPITPGRAASNRRVLELALTTRAA